VTNNDTSSGVVTFKVPMDINNVAVQLWYECGEVQSAHRAKAGLIKTKF
jgi:hypothetical protein